MELEFFCEPGTDLEWFQYWRSSAVTGYRHLVSKRMRCVFVTIHRKNLASTAREQPILSSYSHLDGASYGVSLTEQTMTSRHQNVSGQDLTYFDDEKGERYIPYVIEPSLGADRVVLAFLCLCL